MPQRVTSMTGVNLVGCTSMMILLCEAEILPDSIERTGMSKRESRVARTSYRVRSGVSCDSDRRAKEAAVLAAAT